MWGLFKEVKACFLQLSAAPSSVTDEDMAVIERFVILMYDKSSSENDINITRMKLYTKRSWQIETILPTAGALLQHIKRAVYQAGHIRGQAYHPAPDLPNPQNWGWQRTGGQWQPFWTALPQASVARLELIMCSCVSEGLQEEVQVWCVGTKVHSIVILQWQL